MDDVEGEEGRVYSSRPGHYSRSTAGSRPVSVSARSQLSGGGGGLHFASTLLTPATRTQHRTVTSRTSFAEKLARYTQLSQRSQHSQQSRPQTSFSSRLASGRLYSSSNVPAYVPAYATAREADTRGQHEAPRPSPRPRTAAVTGRTTRSAQRTTSSFTSHSRAFTFADSFHHSRSLSPDPYDREPAERQQERISSTSRDSSRGVGSAFPSRRPRSYDDHDGDRASQHSTEEGPSASSDGSDNSSDKRISTHRSRLVGSRYRGAARPPTQASYLRPSTSASSSRLTSRSASYSSAFSGVVRLQYILPIVLTRVLGGDSAHVTQHSSQMARAAASRQSPVVMRCVCRPNSSLMVPLGRWSHIE